MDITKTSSEFSVEGRRVECRRLQGEKHDRQNVAVTLVVAEEDGTDLKITLSLAALAAIVEETELDFGFDERH